MDGPVYDAVLGAIGAALERFDPELIGLRPEFSVSTATGSALDRHGADWGVTRQTGETDDSYRARLLGILAVYANGSTVAGLSAAVGGFTGTAPEIIDCCTDGWVCGESAWGETALAGPSTYFSVYVFVNNPGGVAYSHDNMEIAIRRSLPARARAILWHNGTDTSALGEAADAHVIIE